MRQLTLGVQLKERATFASFHTARNEELVAHLRHVSAHTPPGATWFAGPHASGKSHLLRAVRAGASHTSCSMRRNDAPAGLDDARAGLVEVIAIEGDSPARLLCYTRAMLAEHQHV